jgi:hypothetical protein
MDDTYFIECPHCKEDVEFKTREVDGLDQDIEGQCEDARCEAERQFVGMIDPDELPENPRLWHDLSAAIRRGDRGEAEYLLDRIAAEIGKEATDAVEQGRFSHMARAA